MTVSETPANRRRAVRYFAATMAALTSLMYFLIGLGTLTVLENPAEQTSFGLTAGAAFLVATLMISFFDRRALMGLGALAQALIIFAYFGFAAEREPSFETWGILIRLLQILLLGALTYLAIRPQEPTRPGQQRQAERAAVGRS
ncbi:MAG: hypothetical protein ACRDWS_04475 [Acidimicrobiia bacterium]